MRVAQDAEDTEKVEADDGLVGVTKAINETRKHFGFGHRNGDGGRNTEDFEEWIEKVFKRIRFGGYEAPKELRYAFNPREMIFNAGSLVLKPTQVWLELTS